MPAERLHVTLELDRESEPIRGTLRVASRAMEFSGWLALIAELDGLRRMVNGNGEPGSENGVT